MTIIDHVTVHLHSSALRPDPDDLLTMLARLGFEETAANEEIAANWDVRWFRPVYHQTVQHKRYGETILHLVAGDDWPDQPVPGLSHFCAAEIGMVMFDYFTTSKWLEHHTQGSGRLWLNYHGLRIEVRP